MWAKFLAGLFGFFNRVMDNLSRAEDKKAGVREAEAEKRKKRDKIRKDADAVWDGPDRSRVRRPDGDD